MTNDKVEWIKYRKGIQLKNVKLVKCSTIDTIDSTQIKIQKKIEESIVDYSRYKVESTLGDRVKKV